MVDNFICKLVFIVLVTVGVYKEAHSVPLTAFAECTSETDCGQGRCCVIGMHRYSVPSCMAVGKLGDYCLGGGKSQNLTLSFPNGLSFRVVNTYTLFCPCDDSQGLICHRAQCIPRDNAAMNNVF